MPVDGDSGQRPCLLHWGAVPDVPRRHGRRRRAATLAARRLSVPVPPDSPCPKVEATMARLTARYAPSFILSLIHI